MSSYETAIQRAKLLGLLRYIAPVLTGIMTVIAWVMVGDDIPALFYGVLLVIAVQEFFFFGFLARRAERQAERDRG